MASFENIIEERQFTNPHVRFRRIRGKIVPIFGKKRIGQDVERAGNRAMKVGSLGVAAGVATSIIKKKTKFGFKKKAKWAPKTFKGKLAKAATAPLRKPGKFGAALVLAGAAAHIAGAELQMRSRFGRDL